MTYTTTTTTDGGPAGCLDGCAIDPPHPTAPHHRTVHAAVPLTVLAHADRAHQLPHAARDRLHQDLQQLRDVGVRVANPGRCQPEDIDDDRWSDEDEDIHDVASDGHDTADDLDPANCLDRSLYDEGELFDLDPFDPFHRDPLSPTDGHPAQPPDDGHGWRRW